jgi:DNA-binding NarL/FixJ family response regulator
MTNFLRARASMRTRVLLIPSTLLGLGVPLRELSDREQQIIRLLGEGKSLTEISAKLVLTYKAVADAVPAIKQKLGASTTPALIKFAVELRSRTPTVGAEM